MPVVSEVAWACICPAGKALRRVTAFTASPDLSKTYLDHFSCNNTVHHTKMSASSGSIAIIGAGSVGAAIAYSLLLRQVVADIILVDINHEYCQAQVEDLSDATFLSNVRIRQGTAEDARNADIIIISAGAKQKPGETRIGLIDRNIKVLESVTKSLQPIRSDAILLIVANPVDILTFYAQRLSGLPRNQVIGSGTMLDSIRLTGILANKLKVGVFQTSAIRLSAG